MALDGPKVERGASVEKEPNNRTAEILDLATERRREREVVDVEAKKTLIVVFELGAERTQSGVEGTQLGAASPAAEDEYYGLLASAVESIVAVQEVTYVPGTPAWILGVVNVRGEIESVLDLRAVLGLGQTEVGAQSRLLIAQEGELRSGLLVGPVIDIADTPTASISTAPLPQEGSKGVYVKGQADYFDKPLLLLDLAEVFGRALEADKGG